MYPRSFWKVLLKISGLLFFIDSLPVMMHTLSTMYQALSGEDNKMITLSVYAIILSALVFGITYLLIFQSDIIINKLRLHEGFEEDIFKINMHRSTILTIAVIVLGGWIFIDTLPHICQRITPYFEKKPLGGDYENPYFPWLVFYSAKLFVGILMLIYSRDIVNFIEAKRKRSGSKLLIEPSDKEES